MVNHLVGKIVGLEEICHGCRISAWMTGNFDSKVLIYVLMIIGFF